MKGEELLHDYLFENIESSVVKMELLDSNEKEVIELNYIKLRNLLQEIYSNKKIPDYKNFPSLIYHLIQNRRESLELLFYMSSILIKLKCEITFWLLIYSNYYEHKVEKKIKTIYPEEKDFGLTKRGQYSFPRYSLDDIYHIDFYKLNKFTTLYLKNIAPHYNGIGEINIMKYYVKSIRKNNISKEIYIDTIKNGFYKNRHGISIIRDAVAILKDVELIEETIEFALNIIKNIKSDINPITKIDKENKEENSNVLFSIKYSEELKAYLKNVKEGRDDIDKNKVQMEISALLKESIYKTNRNSYDNDEVSLDDILHSIKIILSEASIIPNEYDRINNLLNKFESFNKLSKLIETGRRKQKRLLKNPNYIYKTSISYDYNFQDDVADFERIEKLRYLDLRLDTEIIYPNNDIKSKDYFEYSYRNAIIERWNLSDLYIPKDERDISNQVREELGIPKIGEGWKNETVLYYIIKDIFVSKGSTVHHHYRPDFLDGQELDIYLEYQEYKIGIEYQGKQHFESVKIFGGDEGLKRTKERDNRKAEKCRLNGIILIYFNHWEPINKNMVFTKLTMHDIKIENN